ncbi:MAG: hypothetical protein AAB839_01885 [Patescibacteria group bacterium]
MRIAVIIMGMIVMGAGCTNPFEHAEPMSGNDLAIEAGLKLEINPWMPFWQTTPSEYTSVTIDAWDATVGTSKISWMELQVTDATNTVVTGSLTTDALLSAERISLPTFWTAGDVDVSGKENSVLWISQAQYNELTTTSSTHIELGLFDSTLSDTVSMAEAVRNAIAAIQGRTQDPNNALDVTKVEFDPAVSTYRVAIDGSLKEIDVITARNAFATYTILKNEKNPLVLQIAVRPWALGLGMFTNLEELKKAIGYKVTRITRPIPSVPPSVDPLPHSAEGSTSSP